MSHAFDVMHTALPRASLRASCDWACPDCELMCGILARTVRDTGADLAAALGQLSATPTADQAREVERLREVDASARRQFDRKRGLPVVGEGRARAPATAIGAGSIH